VAPLLVLSVGAGLYEELIFRLLPFALLGLVLNDWLGVSKLKSAPLVVGFCAVLFALYHYLGGESFTWPSLGFRLFAGGYLGLLLLCRGFGITACCHIAYDVIVVLLQAWATR
jgi:membrane protease YdiL (CAAX protease family)